jgi:hypothetical protein
MAAAEVFPSVDTGAIASCASDLTLIGSAMSDTKTVVTGRSGDANLTSEVVNKAASLLQQLATDLANEKSYYNKVAAELESAQDSYNPRFNPEPPGYEDSYITAMNGAVTRATNLLQQAGNDFLMLATLADDIGAKGAANRMPGVPGGTDRSPASLSLLAFLMGTVLGNTGAGGKFEQQVLNELSLTKNTTIWRPGTAFEGRTTPGGAPKGTIPDAEGPGYVVEIKDTTSLQNRFQIRLESYYARATGRPLWIITKSGAKVDQSVINNAEATRGGVVYRTGPNSYEDGNGNPVKIDPGMKVSGYTPSSTGGTGSGNVGGSAPTNPDPSGPSAPVNPDPAPVDPDPAPVEPVDPVDPIDPIDPLIP